MIAAPYRELIVDIRRAVENGGYVWVHRDICDGLRHSETPGCWCEPFLVSERDDIVAELQRARMVH